MTSIYSDRDRAGKTRIEGRWTGERIWTLTLDNGTHLIKIRMVKFLKQIKLCYVKYVKCSVKCLKNIDPCLASSKPKPLKLISSVGTVPRHLASYELLDKIVRMKKSELIPSRVSHTRKDTSCLLYTSPSPRDRQKSRMPSSA